MIDIILPITCNQVKILCVVMLAIMMVSPFIYEGFITGVLFIIGLMVVCIWGATQFIIWYADGRFPSIRCKCDD